MRRNRTLWIGVSLVSFSLMLAVLSLIWTPYDPLAINPERLLERPSSAHLLGTDENGRDILSNILVGSRATLLTGVLAVLICMVIGVSVGIATAVSPKWVESPAIFGIDIVLALPTVLFAIVLAAVYGPSTLTAVFAIGIALSASVAQVTRREVNVVLLADYVLAARASGSSTRRIVRRHVLPNIRASLFVQASGAYAIAVLAESTLSYLGLGTTPPAPSWGRMMAALQPFLLLDPIFPLWPGLAIVITVLGFNLLGDGLREALDPTLREQAAESNPQPDIESAGRVL
ncbi:MAG: ABC transporter permease [Ilumatobacteraceae bacterium]|jgi:peptide/nickel transport system permease protein